MLALVSTPDPDSPLRLAQVDEPVPAPDEAVVAIHAFAVNRGEIRLLQMRPDGWRPGQDVAGEVVRAAADGSGPPVGARVVALLEMGGWSERVAIATGRLAVLPSEVSYEQAATLPIAGLTALRSLRLGDSLLGRRVLITGASGGVGYFGVQLAVAAGATVAALVRNPAHVVALESIPRVTATNDASTLQPGFDVVIESVGGETFRQALRLVRPRGTIIVIGNSSGEDSRFQIYDFFGHEDARILSFFSYNSPATVREDLDTLLALVADGRLHVEIGKRAPWTDAASLLGWVRERGGLGKAVGLIA